MIGIDVIYLMFITQSMKVQQKDKIFKLKKYYTIIIYLPEFGITRGVTLSQLLNVKK